MAPARDKHFVDVGVSNQDVPGGGSGVLAAHC